MANERDSKSFYEGEKYGTMLEWGESYEKEISKHFRRTDHDAIVDTVTQLTHAALKVTSLLITG